LTDSLCLWLGNGKEGFIRQAQLQSTARRRRKLPHCVIRHLVLPFCVWCVQQSGRKIGFLPKDPKCTDFHLFVDFRKLFSLRNFGGIRYLEHNSLCLILFILTIM
jgi:hypothetical protein